MAVKVLEAFRRPLLKFCKTCRLWPSIVSYTKDHVWPHFYEGISMTKFSNQELIPSYQNCTYINPKLNSNEPIICSKSWMLPTEADGQNPVSGIMHIVKMQKGSGKGHKASRHDVRRHNANRHNAKRENANRHNANRHNAKWHNAKWHNANRHNAN